MGRQVPPRILLFGDSHSYAIQRALERRRKRAKPLPLQAFRLLKIKNDIEVGDTSLEAFVDMARALGPEDVVISTIGGNNHAVFSTIQHAVPFDIMPPGDESGVDAGAELIPYRIVESYFEQAIRNGDGKSIESIRRATSARVFHLIPPPPKADSGFIKTYHESLFAQEGITARGVSSARLRLRFWTLQMLVLRKICDGLGVEILMPPEEGRDPEGFLSPVCYAKDATHANPEYGELVLKHVEQLFLAQAPKEPEEA